MAVSLIQMRELLLPGLEESVVNWRLAEWNEIFIVADNVARPTLPAVPLGPHAALMLGAAAAVVKNPEVTRRWFGWLLDRTK